jgi:hypothetical protein
MIYKAKQNTWFDENTVVELIDDYRDWTSSSYPGLTGPSCGLFSGYRNGKYDEEVCSFYEFDTFL